MMDEKLDEIREAVCDLCHWPYIYRDAEILHAEKCDYCPVERILQEVKDDEAVQM